MSRERSEQGNHKGFGKVSIWFQSNSKASLISFPSSVAPTNALSPQVPELPSLTPSYGYKDILEIEKILPF